MRPLRTLLMLTAVALAALPALAAGPTKAEPAGAVAVGKSAPLFRLKDVVSGKTIGLEDLRGRIVVLHFGTSW